MTSTEKTGDSDSGLSLEPIEDPGFVSSTPALKLPPNSRTKADRRVNTKDRREVLRFESDRRTGKTRRPQSCWDPGNNF